MKKTKLSGTSKFVPTFKDWEHFYSQWFKRLVKSLWKFGRIEIVEDAVQDAFLKVTGLSENRELRDGLKPRTEIEWYAFVKRQAEWILGQEREKHLKGKANASTFGELAKKIVSITENSNLSKTQRSLALRRHRQLMSYLVELEEKETAFRLPSDDLDERHCKAVVRRLVGMVCRKGGISNRNRDAFIFYVLDEGSASEVVARVWGEPASLQEAAERKNNLYVIKNRILRRLHDFADAWRGGGRSVEEFLAAA